MPAINKSCYKRRMWHKVLQGAVQWWKATMETKIKQENGSWYLYISKLCSAGKKHKHEERSTIYQAPDKMQWDSHWDSTHTHSNCLNLYSSKLILCILYSAALVGTLLVPSNQKACKDFIYIIYIFIYVILYKSWGRSADHQVCSVLQFFQQNQYQHLEKTTVESRSF